MAAHETAGRELARGMGRLTIHVVAIIVGFILMVVGLAMGVSLVMMPIGIPVGVVGVFVFFWGLFGRAGNEHGAAPRPGAR